MELEFSVQISGKKEYSNVKFNENPFSGSGTVPCGLAEAQA
jgi:hypothetical protein